MASRHLRKNRRSPRLNLFIAAAVIGVFAAIIVAMAGHVTDGSATAAREPAASAPAAPQPLSQEGRLVAVTPTSVTAQSVDGFARTYLIDAQTNAITVSGSSAGGAGTTFSVNDEVAIVGVVRDGTAVATAVADRRVSNLNGPPMDAV